MNYETPSEASNAYPDGRPSPPVEIVVMVGIAGSGKTTHAGRKFPGYVRISMDEYRKDGSWPGKRRELIGRFHGELPVGSIRLTSGNKKAECVLADDALRTGRSVVVDDTNLTGAIRRPYVALARKHGARARAVFFTDFERARVQNAGRAEGRVDGSILERQLGELERPAESEGFDSVERGGEARLA